MSILNALLACTLLLLFCFGLIELTERSSCRHEFYAEGFALSTVQLTTYEDSTEASFTSCQHSSRLKRKEGKIEIQHSEEGSFTLRYKYDLRGEPL